MNDQQLTEFRSSLRKMERFLFTNLKLDGDCCGVTFNECHILMEISGNRGIAMADLSIKLGMDKSIISRTIETMVQNAIVYRKEDGDDRRKKSLVLTEAGKKKVDIINRYINRKYLSIFQEMGIDDAEQIIKSAKLLSGVFDKWTAAGLACCKGDVCGSSN